MDHRSPSITNLLERQSVFEVRSFVAVEWIVSGEQVRIDDPASGIEIARVTACDAGVARRAIDLPSWRCPPGAPRWRSDAERSCADGWI